MLHLCRETLAHEPLAFIDGLGGAEMLLIFVIVLLLFGGEKLPEFARGLGKTMREFKKAASGVEEEFRRAMEEDERKRAAAASAAAAPAPAPAAEGAMPAYPDDLSGDYGAESGAASPPAKNDAPPAPEGAGAPAATAPAADAPAAATGPSTASVPAAIEAAAPTAPAAPAQKAKVVNEDYP